MKLLQFSTVLLSGLIAGLFYSYSCSVNPGLKALTDVGYLKSMQSINIAIQNPVFFISFIGLLVLYPLTIYQMHQQTPSLPFYLFIISMVAYCFGVFAVTIFFNVPLNEQLAEFTITSATTTEISAMRTAFEKPWNTFHAVRTFAAVLSFSLLIIGLLVESSQHETI